MRTRFGCVSRYPESRDEALPIENEIRPNLRTCGDPVGRNITATSGCHQDAAQNPADADLSATSSDLDRSRIPLSSMVQMCVGAASVRIDHPFAGVVRRGSHMLAEITTARSQDERAAKALKG